MGKFLLLFLWIGFVCTSCESKAGSGALVGAGGGTTTGAVISRSGKAPLVADTVFPAGGSLIGTVLEDSDRQALEKYPQTLHKLERGEPLSIEDIKKMSKAGLSDSVIVDQIDATNSAFYLNTTDIISLKKAKVSQRVIDHMIQSGNR